MDLLPSRSVCRQFVFEFLLNLFLHNISGLKWCKMVSETSLLLQHGEILSPSPRYSLSHLFSLHLFFHVVLCLLTSETWRGSGKEQALCLCCQCASDASEGADPHHKTDGKPRRYLSKKCNGLYWKPNFDWCEVWDFIQVRIHAAMSTDKADDPE